MRSRTCYIGANDIFLQNCSHHFDSGPKKSSFSYTIDEDFFLVLVYTFMDILTKFQLFTIWGGGGGVRVKRPERLD